jgi:hemolysin III
VGAISVPGLVLLAVGGGLYSLGVVFHLWNRLPYQNAIWHAFVLAAAACHFSAVLSEVAIAG